MWEIGEILAHTIFWTAVVTISIVMAGYITITLVFKE